MSENSKGWGAIAKLLPLVDLFLLSTNEKALFFTVLSELSVAYFMDKNYLKPIFISTAMDSWSCAGEDAVLLKVTIDAIPIDEYYFRGPWCEQDKWYMKSIRGREIFQD